MPIKGVTDRIRLPRKGIIRIGEKKTAKNGKEYPVSLDHFIGPPEFHEKFGLTPKEIPFLFPYNDIGENFTEDLKAYKAGGKLFCKGDGESASRSDGKGGMIELACPHHDCEYYKKKECKPIGIINFLITDICLTACYQLSTSSIKSMTNIRSTILLIKHMFGTIRDIPMILKVNKEKATPWVIDKTGNKKQITTEVPIVTIECALSFPEVEMLAENKKSLVALSAPKDEIEPDENVNDDVFPEELYLSNQNNEEEEESFHPVVEKFLKYDDILYEESGTDLIKKYMTIVDPETQKTKRPTLQQIKKWNSEKEIKYLSGIISKIENDFKGVMNAQN